MLSNILKTSCLHPKGFELRASSQRRVTSSRRTGWNHSRSL